MHLDLAMHLLFLWVDCCVADLSTPHDEVPPVEVPVARRAANGGAQGGGGGDEAGARHQDARVQDTVVHSMRDVRSLVE